MWAEYKSQGPPPTFFILLKVCSLRIIMTSGALFLLMGIVKEKRANNNEVEIVQ